MPSPYPTTEVTTVTITPAIRFRAAAMADSLTYDGARNLRVSIETAAKIESFPGSYSLAEVAAAEALLIAAAERYEGLTPMRIAATHKRHAEFVAVVR